MLKLPFYTFNNYQPIVKTPYENCNTSDWIELEEYLKILTPEFISTYANVNSTQLGNYISANSSQLNSSNLTLQDKNHSLNEILTCMKLLFPTLRTCKYFFWDIGSSTHHGIDIIMPQGTPLPAFANGSIIRIKNWDGQKKDEGNCVVIKGNDNLFYCYEHMQEILVTQGTQVNAGDIIGKCGTTGNSTQFHLHLQIDQNNAPFHPFYSNKQSITEIQDKTVDPIKILRSNFQLADNAPSTNTSTTPAPTTVTNPDILDSLVSSISSTTNNNDLFTDMPSEEIYQNAITKLYDLGMIKGYNNQIKPNDFLKRYEFALIIFRFLNKFDLWSKIPIQNNTTIKYSDIDYSDTELADALNKLYQYGIMKGGNQKFSPADNLKGEEILAVLGRSFYKLSDMPGDNWYAPYLEKFVNSGIIITNWPYINNALPRKEIFKLLANMISIENL